MDTLARNERIVLLGAFAMAIREGRFSNNRNETLVEGTVRGTISHVVQAFRSAGRQNPTKDEDHELSILLLRQFQAFKNNDPQQQQQKAIPFIVIALDKLAKRQVTALDTALAQLTIGAAFFACRSCEYSTVPKTEERRTKLLCLGNIRFFADGHLILAPSEDLELANSVAITIEMQENDSKFDTVIHGRTDDTTLCPVLQWARLINRVWAYPGSTKDTPVCAVWRHTADWTKSHLVRYSPLSEHHVQR